MIPDSELLHSYAQRKAEPAFAEVVGRHVNFVYSTALRLASGDAHRAQDITQTVFTELARHAGRLSRHPSLAGWLHTSARYAARNVRVSEQRRRARELEAAMQTIDPPPEIAWEELKPALDEAVGKLNKLDREVVLLRYFDTKSHREIGEKLGLSENAARMRGERALEKLRQHFNRRGVKASAALLATTLAANSVQAAPAGVAAGMPGAALAGLSLKAGLMAGLGRFLFGVSTKAKFATVTIVAGGLASTAYFSQTYRPAWDLRWAATLLDPAPSEALVRANNQFAIDLYKQLAADPAQNIFFSPFSVSTGLTMTWAGARGQTADQIAAALHLTGQPVAGVAGEFGVLQRALARDSNRVELRLANSLWVQRGQPFERQFLTWVNKDFAGAIVPLDFVNQPGPASDQINQWISGQTKGRIANVVQPSDITDKTRLILVDAIYFKGEWATKFDPTQTRPGPFHLANGTDKEVRMMIQDERARRATIPEGPVPFRIVALPYKGEALAFIVLLPDAIDGLAALEQELDADKLAGWLNRLESDEEKGAIGIPKFKLTQRFELNANLQALGIKDAFSNEADFSGIDGARDLYLARSVHQAYVDVNEEGTEAAAASWSFGMVLAAHRPFVADHPFIFLIRDECTGSILFMGRFATPP